MGMLSPNFDNATDFEIRIYAARCFRLGWEDAVMGKGRKTRGDMMTIVFQGWEGRRLHPYKFRQVYGAGYDLGAMRRRQSVEADRAGVLAKC